MKAGCCKALLILFFKGHIAYHIVKIGGSRYRKHSSLRVFSRFQQKNGLSRAFHSQLLKMHIALIVGGQDQVLSKSRPAEDAFIHMEAF